MIETLLNYYLDLLEQEPAQDAGRHPSHDVHERVGAKWAEWDRKVAAVRSLIVPRLFEEAVEARKAMRP